MDLSGSVNNLVNSFVAWLPKLVTVIAILIVGYIISIVLKMLVQSALQKLGFDRRLDKSPAHNVVRRLTHSPSEIVGKLIYWVALIITITVAIFAMNLAPLNQILQGIYAYIPNILAAIVILVIALAAATAVSSLSTKLLGDTPTGKTIATVGPVIILSISVFAILVELKLAPSIVLATYIALVGSLALGFALAFGLGGRDVASRMLEQAYQTGKNNAGQVKRDFEKGKDRAEREAREEKRKLDEENR